MISVGGVCSCGAMSPGAQTIRRPSLSACSVSPDHPDGSLLEKAAQHPPGPDRNLPGLQRLQHPPPGRNPPASPAFSPCRIAPTFRPDQTCIGATIGGEEGQFGGLEALAVHHRDLVACPDWHRPRAAARHRVPLHPMGQDRQARDPGRTELRGAFKRQIEAHGCLLRPSDSPPSRSSRHSTQLV